ncbi:asparagine synthetase B [Salinibacter sp. 10B]|uniref:asparagine synthetase B n=1 Tax=Salinibacter sp. 10B TaxID=1923971 RepID=UPI000D28D71A|nr:asparagine synthetase B [Salinibacter sp. 10B]PQJ35526.1 asparagine synthetase B [Salinibacter sp. 10B]
MSVRPLFYTVLLLLLAWSVGAPVGQAQDVLIPMDNQQSDHLKAYGAVYGTLNAGQKVDWLLNYRGGSFLTNATTAVKQELRTRGVSFQEVGGAQASQIIAKVEADGSNMAVVPLEKAPKIAVYAPSGAVPWDDAVRLALNYADVPHDVIYDDAVLNGKLDQYDWLHLHHEDFTGQFGKFIRYRNEPWYIQKQKTARELARKHGYRKVSQLKLAVTQRIRDYVRRGGFMFSMCSGTETFDIALAARKTDIVPEAYDGDPVNPNALDKLDYGPTLAFTDFRPNLNAQEYSHSNIDVGPPPTQIRDPSLDYFTLFDFSAKWDPVPTMLTQNHVATVKGFVGQTTAFKKDLVKEDVVVLAKPPERDQVRYLHGTLGQGTFTFYSGHDPEDYQHFVGDPPTDLSLHPNSPGYRLILNNILFPAAKKKKQKT